MVCIWVQEIEGLVLHLSRMLDSGEVAILRYTAFIGVLVMRLVHSGVPPSTNGGFLPSALRLLQDTWVRHPLEEDHALLIGVFITGLKGVLLI